MVEITGRHAPLVWSNPVDCHESAAAESASVSVATSESDKAKHYQQRMAEAAGKAAKTQSFKQMGEKALAEMLSVNYQSSAQGSTHLNGTDKPQLQAPAPRSDEEKRNAAGEFVRLMAFVAGLVEKTDANKLTSNLAQYLAKAQAQGNQHEALSRDYQAALAQLKAAVEAAGSALEGLEEAKAAVEQAQGELDAAEAHLAGLNPKSKGYEAAVRERDGAKAALAQARQAETTAEKTFTQATDAAAVASTKAENLRSRVQSSGQTTQALQDSAKSELNSAGMMVLLIGKYIELMKESADRRLESQKADFEKKQEAAISDLKRQAQEYAEAVAAAAAASETSGCIGM